MWFAYRMSGFGGLWVPEKVTPVAGGYVSAWEHGENFRTDADGVLCESEEACERYCDHKNGRGN